MNAHELFGPFLNAVQNSLEKQLAPLPGEADDVLLQAARHLILGSGKRARPLLVKIFGTTLGLDDTQLIDVAVAAELVHGASLLHDDVVDVGTYRRGQPTVNALWGNTVAVLAGDLVLSAGLQKMCAISQPLGFSALATVHEMTAAAIVEVQARGNLDLPLAKLRAIAEGKTGALFGWCGRAAGLLASDQAAGAAFDLFGRRLGVAFQMADDIRDITGTDVGKPQYADLQSRTPSLPIVLAMQRDARLKQRVHEVWAFTAMTPEKVRELGTAVLVSSALDEATAMMNEEIDAAVAALGPYADHPAGAALVRWARDLAQGMALRGAA